MTATRARTEPPAPAGARQLPANARRPRARRAAARDPLRAPPPRHGPPVHRRPQRARRRRDSSGASRRGPTSTSACACAAAAPAAATRSTAHTSRSSRSTRRTRVDRLRDFRHRPSMIVLSGTPGTLTRTSPCPRRSPSRARAANRRLAHALGGDLASVDAARILQAAVLVEPQALAAGASRADRARPGAAYDLDELVDGLDDPPGPPARRARERRRTGSHRDRPAAPRDPCRRLRARLTGVTPDRAGKIHCPFHEDRTPSLQLYDDGTWYCFGACQAGGSIFDFAARAWRMARKGRDFLELRERLADELLPPRPGNLVVEQYVGPTAPAPHDDWLKSSTRPTFD